MKIRIRLLFSILIGAALVLVPFHTAQAAGSGAWRIETPDAGPFGMGSAFIGEADRPSALYYNPAGITQIKGQNQLSVGMAFIQPHVTHTNAGVETQMRTKTPMVPHSYFVTDLGLDDWSFGIGTGSNWGTGTEWNGDSFARYDSTRSELISIDSTLVGAYQVNDQLSVAAGFRVADQKASLERKLANAGFADVHTQLKGSDTGYGYSVSALYKLNEQHQFGLQYRSAIELNLKGKAHLHNMAAGSALNAVVFGGSSFTTDAQAELTMPQVISAGYSFKPDDKWTFNLDVEWTDWSSSEQLDVVYPSSSLTALQRSTLNTADPKPKDWNDAYSAAVGVEYAYSDTLRLRGGYYWHESPIPDATLDTVVPDSDSHGITTGFGYDFSSDIEFDFAYSLFLFEDRTVDNTISNALGASVDGTFEEYMHIALATLTYKF